MKRQSTRKVVSQAASDAVNLAEAGAEVVAAGVLLTAGIVGATAELAVAKVLMSEKHQDHGTTSGS
jgi:hypothetical protein